MKVNQEIPLPARPVTPRVGLVRLPNSKVLSVASFMENTNRSLRIRKPIEATGNTTLTDLAHVWTSTE